jgi:hypothetical protein
MALAGVTGRRARLIALFVAATAGAALSLGAAAAESFKARLAPVPIDATIAASVTGGGAATADLDGRKLKLSGHFAGLQGAATIAQLHAGPVTGVRGPVIADFKVPAAQSGDFNAELTLTAAQADSLRRGRVYLQIHSASAPEGNLWGWLLP